MAERMRQDRGGFSLIEVLVALAVFSLAAIALLNLAGENTRSASRAETRALAGIVAENIAVGSLVSLDPPSIGEAKGEARLAERDWRWTRTVHQTDVVGMLRIDVTVADADGEAGRISLFRSVL